MFKEYRGEYGRLVVDLDNHKVVIDELDRDKIITSHSSREYNYACKKIIDELMDIKYSPEPIDFAYRVDLEDGWKLQVDSRGVYFIEDFTFL